MSKEEILLLFGSILVFLSILFVGTSRTNLGQVPPGVRIK